MSGLTSSLRGSVMTMAPRRERGYPVPAGASDRERETLRTARREAALNAPPFDHALERRSRR